MDEIERRTAEIKDRENGLKKDKERQWKPKTERMDRDKEKERQRKSKTGRIDERTWRNDSGSQRQREWTKERERTIAETKDRENGLR